MVDHRAVWNSKAVELLSRALMVIVHRIASESSNLYLTAMMLCLESVNIASPWELQAHRPHVCLGSNLFSP
jgi:hypothetical protein